jgi:integrase
MARLAKELGPLAVSNLTAPGLHFVGGVPGLALQILPTGGKTWILRVMIGGKRRDMGLGGYSKTGNNLAKAREKAVEARDAIKKGTDPIEVNKAARSALKASRAAALTFKQCAAKYIAAHKAGWKNEKHAGQWLTTLETYAYPEIGDLLVRDVGVTNVLAILEKKESADAPTFWNAKTETASRVRGRIESVLDWATARKYRTGENPARWRGHLDKLLPAPAKIAKVEHHKALPVDDVGAFMVDLRKREGTAARALEFAILTATRSGETRGAAWDEIDLHKAVWTIPGERMKAGREHRVPLSDAAVKLLKSMEGDKGLVFASATGGELSDMTMTKVLRDMKVPAVPHGFRSSFRDWAAERTNYPREVCEAALAHMLENKTEAAYFRTTMFDKRRQLMQAWATFCAKPQVKPEAKGKVVNFPKQA